jgi:acyl carrier protein
MKDGKQLQWAVLALVSPLAPSTVDLAAVGADVSLYRDLGVDSLGLADLVVRFARWLGVEPDDLVEAIGDQPVQTLADLVALGVKINRGAGEGFPS